MKFVQLILRKIIKIVATRCQILRLKCIKFDFGWGSAPDPAGGAYSVPPDRLAGFGGRFAAGEGQGKRRERGREGEVEGREREGPQVTVEPGPLRALLRHWLFQFSITIEHRQTRMKRQFNILQYYTVLQYNTHTYTDNKQNCGDIDIVPSVQCFSELSPPVPSPQVSE